MSDAAPLADADTSDVEDADIAVVEAVAHKRRTPWVRFAGALSEIADQPQMTAVCGLTIAAGIARRDIRLTRTGLRMLIAHGLATFVKGRIKDAVDRTRPNVALEEGRYEMRAGESRDGGERSFPSGHTSSAVAAAFALTHDYPRAALPAYGLAAAIAAIQVPRAKHYPSDLAAGLAVGLAAGYGATLLLDALAAGLRRAR